VGVSCQHDLGNTRAAAVQSVSRGSLRAFMARGMQPAPTMSDLWYKDAIIYCLDVETYQDSNGDGIGDFPGLTSRLDYLRGLGVSCLWLLPFYPTPNRDNGYDVVDYYNVDGRLGTLGDFVEFMREARERGMRVIVDLVANHTSDQHPWFQSARSDPASPYRDWYVWSEEKPDDVSAGVVFPGVQERIWTYDRKAKAWYLHRFYEHQPDLNMGNPAVRAEVRRIMGFWLELGVSGFRLDAAPFLIEQLGMKAMTTPEPFDYLREFRGFLSWRRGDAVMLAEANVPPDAIPDYFGGEQRLHMLFNFLLNQHLFLALAREEKSALVEGFLLPPRVDGEDQWATFLRNHDELDLGRLSEEQRRQVFEVFAPKENMRLYDRGIRRRLAPMLGGDQARLRMANSLLLTLPGTPIIRYGQEIGMGDDLSLPERNSVRTPMQWSAGHNAGFSTAKPDQLARPLIRNGEFEYSEVNVESQQQTSGSLLHWFQSALRARLCAREFGRGRWELHETGHETVFAHSCSAEGSVAVAIHNLGGRQARARVDLSGLDGSRLTPLFGVHEPVEIEGGVAELSLDRYGYGWFRLGG
jgi:maltose alpha-D-glucosyltransferase/alpha-amylase